MAVYIVRRLVAAFFILIGASFIVYMLMTQAGDPLAFTLAITNPTQRAAVIDDGHRDAQPRRPAGAALPRLAPPPAVRGRLRLVSDTQQPVGTSSSCASR